MSFKSQETKQMNPKEKIEKLCQMVDEIVDEIVERRDNTIKKLFPQITQAIFDKYPVLQSFSWTQYTPYFNDGDTCHFHVHTCSDAIYLNVGDDEEYDWNCPDEYHPIQEEIAHTLSSIPEDFFLSFFGDHMKITVHRDGTIDKDDYHHD